MASVHLLDIEVRRVEAIGDRGDLGGRHVDVYTNFIHRLHGSSARKDRLNGQSWRCSGALDAHVWADFDSELFHFVSTTMAIDACQRL